ncbi:MAG: hypothetical protein JXA42_14385 [Anaerolineales bacterium]|nr:hypothetical protein [Anaerolineales bacterium]
MKRLSERGSEHILLILILLTAAFFRFFALDKVPPGLTHDEANNVHDAASILDGIRPFYFPVAQGKEPLYIYSAGGLMALVGRTPWTLRFSSAIWGMLLIIITFTWVRKAFDKSTALVTSAGLAVCFWPVTTARLGLRAVTLPVLFTAFTFLFWQITNWSDKDKTRPAVLNKWDKILTDFRVILTGVVLGLCLYTYLASRLLVLIILPFFIFLLIFHRSLWKKNWKQYCLIFGISILVIMPMFVYLYAHPSAEIRINQLNRPLELFLAGDVMPLLDRIQQAVQVFSIKGDTFVPYNIPGKPLIEPFIGIFFYAGLVITLWKWKRPANMYALLWFVIGMIPAMVTGVEAANLRLYLIQPVVFLFPALAWARVWRWIDRLVGRNSEKRWSEYGLVFGIVVLLVYGGVITSRDYLNRWAENTDVRVHYHVDLVEIAHIVDRYPGKEVGISVTYPGEYHDPRVVEAQLGQNDSKIRWFDGRESLVIPPVEQSVLIVPSRTILSPLFEEFIDSQLRLIDTVPMQPDDFEKGFSIYSLFSDSLWNEPSRNPLARLGDKLLFNSAKLYPDKAERGQTIELVTEWTIIGRLPDERDGKLFVHLLDQDGTLLAQDDRLGAPSWNWHPWDRLYQIFHLSLPDNINAGRYRLVLGAYTTADRVDSVLAGCEPDLGITRLLVSIDGEPAGDSIELDLPLVVLGD